MTAIDIARSGLTAALMRLNASASNVANADTVGPRSPRTPADGEASQVYQPVAVEARAAPGGGVAATYTRSRSQPVARYEPSSPAADASGLVAAPDVDLVDERVQQVIAASDFRANVAVVDAADRMQKSAIDLLA